MNDLLVQNPKKYVLNFIGMKNEEELAVAIEIYLAEKVFEPRFDSGLNYDSFKELDSRVSQLYEELGKQDLTALFYFNYVNFAIETGIVDESIINEFKIYVAERILRHSNIQSRIAKNLLKTSDFYKSVHNDKVKGLNDSDSLEKVMGLITLQNKELYSLEMERMEGFDEYEVFEKYRKELEGAEKELLVNHSNM